VGGARCEGQDGQEGGCAPRSRELAFKPVLCNPPDVHTPEPDLQWYACMPGCMQPTKAQPSKAASSDTYTQPPAPKALLDAAPCLAPLSPPTHPW
jgi:hypothetical protein